MLRNAGQIVALSVAGAVLGGLSVGAPRAEAQGAAATRFPIFLAEGFGGIDYLGVREALEAQGASVCNPPDDEVPHFAGSETRAPVLIGQIEACAAAFGVTRVNYIGHSLGGMDGRVVLAQRPDLIASLTTVGSPHRFSSGIADRLLACGTKQQLGLSCSDDEVAATQAFVALGQVATDPDAPTPTAEDVIEANCQISSGTNLLAALACTTNGFKGGIAFGLAYPLGLPLTACGNGASWVIGPGLRRIYLYSWAGSEVATDASDPSDAYLAATAAFINAPSDGLAAKCGTHFGRVIDDNYPLNHLDLINQLGTATGGVDVPAIFVQHATRLKAKGL